MPVAKSYLEKIDPQMWITLIGFVFTLGIIYGEFQTMKNQIYIFEEKQKIFLVYQEINPNLSNR